MVKKLFGINSNTSSHHQNVHQPTTFMVVDDPSVLQGFYNEQQQQQNQQQLLNSTTTNNGANNVSANNNGGWNLGGLTQQQQQQLLNQFASSSISSSSSNNNNNNNNGMMNQGNYSSSLPNNMNNMNSNNNFSSFGINNGNLFITTSNNNMNNNMNTNMNNNMNTNNMAMNNMTMNNMNNNNTNLMMTNSMNNNGNNFMMQSSSSYNSNNNNSNNMFRLDDLSTNNTNTNNNNSIGRNNNNNISNNNNSNTFMFGQGSSSTSTSNHQQQQQQPFIVNNVNNQSVNIVLNNENAAKKYAPVIKWSLAPSTAYSFSNQSTSNMISNEADNIMSQTLIDPVFGPDDCKVSKGAQLTNTKLFCLSDQITRDFQFLRPSVQTDNLYHLTEMENESSWLPNDRIAPKKTSHNCLVNDWLVFCSQDPQLLKLVGRYINGASNTDIQLFADFVLVTSNNHDEDSRESLFGKQRFKGGIPLQMKLVRNSANNANMTPLLYFEKRINRESVNNKDAPSASGMGGKRVAQLRIYLKDSTQEICLVHSDGFWVRTKSREEIHRTSPREVQPQPQPQETVTKKKRNAFYGFFQGNGGRAVKRDQQNAIVVESPRVFMDSQGNYQQTTITEIVATQPFQQQLDLSQVSNSASSYGSNSYLSNSGGFALHGVSPISNQIQMQNGGNDELSSSLSSTPNNNSHLSVSQQNISTTDVAEILRNLSISLPNNHGGHHSRNSSFTSPNGLASSCSSTSSSSYLVPNSSNSTDIGFHSLLEPQPGEPIDNTISKLDAAIQFFSTMKDAYLKIKNNQSADMPNMGELCAQFSSSLQDKRGRDNKGFKRVRQGNESGAVSPQSNHSGKSLTVPFRTTSSSAPNTSTLNMNGSSPLVNNVISNVGYPGVAFNGNNNVMVNQGMQFNNNFITNSSSLNNLPMKNFDGDLPHTLFNSADTDANQDIFNM